MNYQKIYNQIIERAQNRKLEGYKEKHHIIPRCIGGKDEITNLAELTAREHFLCHMLLCEIYPKENKLKHALFLMAIGKRVKKEKIYIINSRTYERLKKEYSHMLTGKKQSQETKDKKSKTMKMIWDSKSEKESSLIGQKRWNTRIKNGTNVCTKTQAQNISKSLIGRKITWNRGVNKCINQYDLEGNFIKEWESISEAKRNIKGDISRCLSGGLKTSGGYLWKYK